MGSYSLQQQSSAIADTGTSFIAGHPSVVRKIMAELSAYYDEDNDVVNNHSYIYCCIKFQGNVKLQGGLSKNQ